MFKIILKGNSVKVAILKIANRMCWQKNRLVQLAAGERKYGKIFLSYIQTKNGFKNISNISVRYKSHEKSTSHIDNIVSFDRLWKKQHESYF